MPRRPCLRSPFSGAPTVRFPPSCRYMLIIAGLRTLFPPFDRWPNFFPGMLALVPGLVPPASWRCSSVFSSPPPEDKPALALVGRSFPRFLMRPRAHESCFSEAQHGIGFASLCRWWPDLTNRQILPQHPRIRFLCPTHNDHLPRLCLRNFFFFFCFSWVSPSFFPIQRASRFRAFSSKVGTTVFPPWPPPKKLELRFCPTPGSSRGDFSAPVHFAFFPPFPTFQPFGGPGCNF